VRDMIFYGVFLVMLFATLALQIATRRERKRIDELQEMRIKLCEERLSLLEARKP
jgi:hypothetical protein